MHTPLQFDASRQFSSPIGAISLFARDHAIVALKIGGQRADNTGTDAILGTAQGQLERYLAGKSQVLDFAVTAQGTGFQQRVWAEIAKLGFGQTTSYAQIARALGQPLASRAVGGAVGANPLPLVIGCHRVLGASGKITGYSGGDGLPTKRWLLQLEGIALSD
jgi:methylated-DNA-[protein]-cysteine S-methyltransferase